MIKYSVSTSYRFHIDPGHGWLQVAWSDLKNLGLNPTDFSRCSYRRGNQFFLEEDCDAPKFIAAYVAKIGQRPAFEEVYSDNRSFVRNCAPIY
jgi:hypothetical protein